MAEDVRSDDKTGVARPRRSLWWILLLAALLLLLLGVLRSCLPSQPRAEDYYVAGELVLSGAEEQVAGAIEAANRQLGFGPEEGLRIVETIRYDFLADLPADQCPEIQSGASGQYVTVRVAYAGEIPLDQVLQAIPSQDGAVTAEPNYVTGYLPSEVRPQPIVFGRPWTVGGSPWTVGGSPWTVGGSPWTVGGSPWTVGGSPWTVGGSPWTVGGSPAGASALADAQTAFWNQWALKTIGVMPPGANADQTAALARAGSGVRIGVFDTSPFPVTAGDATLQTADAFGLRLRLEHPIPGGRFEGRERLMDMRDHGLFVAGMIHAVAPASEIVLYRVLDDTAQGDLFTLERAVAGFISDYAREREGLRGAIVNLSLGVRPTPEELAGGLPTDVVSLQKTLQAARCAGIVVVAAAGNDSAGLSAPEPANIPAAWTDLSLGVAASNVDGQRACFSNAGEMLAPGGDGGVAPPECEQTIHLCAGASDCKYGLISLSLLSPTGFIYWNGSSFAAPLASGAAARLYGAAGVTARGVAPSDPRQIAENVEAALLGEAAAHGGVLFVP